jgi:nucleotide-binding universal stress UspA family protein
VPWESLISASNTCPKDRRGSWGCQTAVSESKIWQSRSSCFVLCALFYVNIRKNGARGSKFKNHMMQISSILFPTDFSECGNYALSYAASLARTFKASIICLNVIEPIVPTVGYSGMTEPLPIADIAEQLEDSAERELPKLAECDECSGLEVEELVVHGEAAAEIVRVAKDRNVDLIVIASHGRTGLGRILFGSTAEAVVRHAQCPVLVVKPPQEETEQ